MARQGSARCPDLGLNVRLPEEADVIFGHHRHVLAQVVTVVAHDVPKDKSRSTSSGSGAVAVRSLWRCMGLRWAQTAASEMRFVASAWGLGVWELSEGIQCVLAICCWLLERNGIILRNFLSTRGIQHVHL